MIATSGAAAQQLAEFLAAIADARGEREATREAVTRIAEVFEAEVTAYVAGSTVVDAIGFGAAGPPVGALLDVVGGRATTLDIPGAGEASALVVPVDGDRRTWVVLARSGAPLGAEEVSLLRGMARVLSLALRMLRTLEREHRLLDGLRDRQRLLEHLSMIERSISSRRPLQETLDAVTRAAADLFGDEVVGLRILDRDNPTLMSLVASVGIPPSIERELHRVTVTKGVGARAIRENRLVVQEDYVNADEAYPQFVEDGLRAAMGTPVHENGVVMGSLVVATRRPGRRYTQSERDMLAAFADHVSLALNDAFALHQLDRALGDAVHQATHDALTGLPNRVLLQDRLSHALARSRRLPTTVAIVFVDLDDFKLVNDSLGHAAGDDLLHGMATRLAASIRPGDTAARLGGDEFAILLEDVTGEAEALAIAERLLPSLAMAFPVGGAEVLVTPSLGLAVAEDGAMEPGELLRRADLAMYRSKAGGKNRVTVYRPEMQDAVQARVSLVSELRHAIEDGSLVLHYQPIVDLRTRRVSGVEALVRWEHPTRGLLSPIEFVPLAEERDLIAPLGDFVLRAACAQVRAWHSVVPDLALNVNLSPRELLDPGAANRVLTAVYECGFDPTRLVLEITESVMLHDADATRDRLRHLREAGIAIALDDFGTGYSSLAYLTRFPVDVLKVDRAFVNATSRSDGERAVVDAIVHLARTIGLTTIAEGIETASQLNTLLEIGCTSGQGYLLGAPMPAVAMTALLSGRPEPAHR